MDLRILVVSKIRRSYPLEKKTKVKKVKRVFKMVAVEEGTKQKIDAIVLKYKSKQYALMDEAMAIMQEKYPV